MRRPLVPALLALAALAGSCAPRSRPAGTATADSTLTGAVEVPASSRSEVTFVELTPRTRRAALALRQGGGDSLLLMVQSKGRNGRVIVLHRGADGAVPSTLASLVGALEDAGSVDLHGDGTRDAFFVTSDSASGLTNRELDLYCPSRDKLLTLTLTFMHDATQPVPSVVRSDELERPEYGPEARFLAGIQRDYGFVSEAELARDNDPRQAFYYWRTDNAGHADGAPIKTRRFAGRPAVAGSLTDSLASGGLQITAYRRSGVMAYDPASDQHWVLFHPDDPNDWPTHLATAGDVLVIGTHGEGLAVIQLGTLTMRRLKVLGNDDVQKLSIEGDVIVVNGVARVAF